MAERGGERERGFCAYCGCVIRSGRTCRAHHDLERLDPHALAARRRLSERELGIANPWKIPPHAGREELR